VSTNDSEFEPRDGLESISPSGRRTRRKRRKKGSSSPAPIPTPAEYYPSRVRDSSASGATESLNDVPPPRPPVSRVPEQGLGAIHVSSAAVPGVKPPAHESLSPSLGINSPRSVPDEEFPAFAGLTDEAINRAFMIADAVSPQRSPSQATNVPVPKDELPPLPQTIAVLADKKLFDEWTGKRRRSKEHAPARRKCPFCSAPKALRINTPSFIGKMSSMIGIQTYSCRACHSQHFGFSFLEGLYFTGKHVRLIAFVVLAAIVIYAILHPLFNRLPDLQE
jgi:hypothetical protein